MRAFSSLFCLLACALAAPASALAQGTVVLLTSAPDAATLAGPLALELGSATTLEVVVSPAGDLDTEAQAHALVVADPSVTVVLVERERPPPRVHVIGASGERSTPLPAIAPEHAPRIAATIAASLVAELREGPLRLSATTLATTPVVIEPVDDALALAAPGDARAGGPTLFAQLGVGVLLREEEGAADPTFTQRIALGLELDGTFRLALTVALPMFHDEYAVRGEGPHPYTGSSTTASYLGGVELSHRAQLDLLALHVGGHVVGGVGQATRVSDGRSIVATTFEDAWAPTLTAGGFGAIGLAATGNTDLLLRADVGLRVHESYLFSLTEDPGLHAELVGQLTLAVDWH